MNLAALSLDQAPPLSVPMRFFLTAPLFGMAASLALLLGGPGPPASRWMPLVLAVTHLVLLGVVVPVMFGAVQQMLPVVAGSPIARPRLVSAVVHLTWSAGVTLLALGLLLPSTTLMTAAGALLVAGAMSFLGAAARSLRRPPASSETTTAMRLALLSFAAAAGLGATLAEGYGGWVPLWRIPLTNIHALWALIGWIGLLIIGVSYQVVPMFQMTPPYPPRLRRLLVPTLFAALCARSAAGLLAGVALAPVAGAAAGAVALGAEALISACLLLFAAATIRVQAGRRRTLSDTTFTFFRLGMAGLVAAIAFTWIGKLALLPGETAELVAGLAWVFGFVLPVVMGMLYKIVPFLVWFHLQGLNTRRIQQRLPLLKLPNMRDAIPPRFARAQLGLHGLALALLLAAPLSPAAVTSLAALALLVDFALLEWALVVGWLGYRLHLRAAAAADAPNAAGGRTA